MRAWAEVAGHYAITDPRTLNDLSPFHIWTMDYAHKRLAWKRRHPLHVVLLRTYRIPRPVTVRVRGDYRAAAHGSRSPATCRSRAPRCSPTTSSTAFATRSSRSAPSACPSWSDLNAAAERVLAGATRALAIGIGGGGDVAGALAVAAVCERLGTECEVGGLTWERRPIDPLPGPRHDRRAARGRGLHAVRGALRPATPGPAAFASPRAPRRGDRAPDAYSSTQRRPGGRRGRDRDRRGAPRLRDRRAARRRRRRPRARRRAGAREPARRRRPARRRAATSRPRA